MSSASAKASSGEALLPRPGALLKALRLRKGLTLAEVSERTGLPVPTLSKLENDKISFSYDKLMQVSQGLKLDISELLSPEPSALPQIRAIGRRSVSRAGDGVTVHSGSYVYQHLGTDLLDKAFVPMVGEIRARSLEEFGEMIQHPGEEFVYVLKGALELHTRIYAPVLLDEGDSIYFDSDMDHAYISAGPGHCTVLSICSAARNRGD